MHVANEQDLVVIKRFGGRGDRECDRVIRAVYQYAGVFEALDRGPRHQQVWCAVALHEESLDQVRACLLVQPDRQIGNAPGHPAVGTQHVLAGYPAEQKHSRSMPRVTRVRRTFGPLRVVTAASYRNAGLSECGWLRLLRCR